MRVFGRRDRETSIESEQERLRALRTAAEAELGRLRRELQERVAAVEARERELAEAVRRARRVVPDGGTSSEEDDALVRAEVTIRARAQELDRREKALGARDQALDEREAALASASTAALSEEQLARIDRRLQTLREAERAFARTQAELAARSEALAQLEAAVSERRLLLGMQTEPGWSKAEMDELDERIRRLERAGEEAAASTFGGGLRSLEQKGTRPPRT